MSINEDKLNIYEINSLLFQIISCMSESERRGLQSVLIDNPSEIENQKDLCLLISSISETKRRELLKKLVIWYNSKSVELREYPRKPFSVPVQHISNGVNFIYFIQNISNDGVFIQTDGNFHIGQQIIMNFSLPKVEKDINVSGKVVRVVSQGIGVKFDELIDSKSIDEPSTSKQQFLIKRDPSDCQVRPDKFYVTFFTLIFGLIL
jgi:Tfp pilus assembly protein PilZ